MHKTTTAKILFNYLSLTTVKEVSPVHTFTFKCQHNS